MSLKRQMQAWVIINIYALLKTYEVIIVLLGTRRLLAGKLQKP